MAKSNSKSKSAPRAFTKILDRSSTPAYFVNCDYEVVFANQACADWVGIELDELILAKCFYSSQSMDDQVKNRCQGLCPPPTLFTATPDEAPNQTEPATASVSATSANGKTTWRSSVMAPMFDDAGSQLGVLVTCGEALQQPPDADPVNCSVNPKLLHDALAQIRTQTDQRHSLESLVGVSSFAERVRRQVKAAIGSRSDLLIHGPSGTGKEHLARTIHSARSTSQNSELLTIHCSIADQHLIQQNIKDIVESQASSSSSQEPDWLLLLDVDKMGEAAQTELLGFLQLPDFPLRLLATSTDRLAELAATGNYSQELAHYLSTMSIELFSLAERKKDVPFLAQALLERDNARRHRQLAGFSQHAMAQLTEFHWPGNINQLNRFIQAAADKTSANEIDKSDLPAEFAQSLSAMRIGTASETVINLDEYLASIEKQLVDRALRQAKGNKTKAAKLLGVSRPKLLRRVQYFELEATPDFSEVKNDDLDDTAFEELK